MFSIEIYLSEKSECKTVISLQNLLLSQTQVSFGNGYRAMVEHFHQLDQGRFGVFAVHVINLSAKGLNYYFCLSVIMQRMYFTWFKAGFILL